jgi:hypothetical protein
LRIRSRTLNAALAALLLVAAAPTPAHAAFVFTVAEIGGNVVVNGSGTLNTTAFTGAGNFNTTASLRPPVAAMFIGGGSLDTLCYSGGGMTGPTSFGVLTIVSFPTSADGPPVGIFGAQPFRNLYVPGDYVSGTSITNSATFAGQSFASLGFTPGTYTYRWGSGANEDSLTIIIPEPSTAGLIGAGLIPLLVRRKARRT